MKFPVLNSDPLPTEPNLKIRKNGNFNPANLQCFNYFSKLILSIEKKTKYVKRLNLESKFFASQTKISKTFHALNLDHD